MENQWQLDRQDRHSRGQGHSQDQDRKLDNRMEQQPRKPYCLVEFVVDVSETKDLSGCFGD